ncbi:unnamed protein product [Diabrotica balteata]|uniref:Uncharacterized protein n=2 Tax=Diabrotica TaxID=50385 RepID=A0A9N9SPB9_DIABA|nr:uncharacterized protein LOC114329265 isoform X1 [Diabrotica virgifera virgifera]CAG9826770.1 unnamed protein product [Diabrotica balteata]
MKFIEFYWLFLLFIVNIAGNLALPDQYKDLFMVQLDKEPRSFDDILNPQGIRHQDVKHVILRIGRNSHAWNDLGFGISNDVRNTEDFAIIPRQRNYKTREENDIVRSN